MIIFSGTQIYIKMNIKQNTDEAIALLKQLIATPSISQEEDKTAQLIYEFLQQKNIKPYIKKNNVWAYAHDFQKHLPTVMLNSHHDTVKPNQGYTRNPFEPTEENGKLYGLGSNDAGGSLVALLATFLILKEHQLPYNLVFTATAEEEISGKNGIESILADLPKIDLAIVGEPTQMHLAIAEKGLMVLDCTVYGKAGHTARNIGENAIYKAINEIQKLQKLTFPKISESLGKIKISVTIINAGTQHNVIPDRCQFTVDVRTTDAYSNEETLKIIQQNVDCEVVPRSTRLNPSGISTQHPIVRQAKKLNISTFASPTMSDQALIPYPSVKIGAGKSERSHTPDEFIYLAEIEEAIQIYYKLLATLYL